MYTILIGITIGVILGIAAYYADKHSDSKDKLKLKVSLTVCILMFFTISLVVAMFIPGKRELKIDTCYLTEINDHYLNISKGMGRRSIYTCYYNNDFHKFNGVKVTIIKEGCLPRIEFHTRVKIEGENNWSLSGDHYVGTYIYIPKNSVKFN